MTDDERKDARLVELERMVRDRDVAFAGLVIGLTVIALLAQLIGPLPLW